MPWEPNTLDSFTKGLIQVACIAIVYIACYITFI